MEKTLAEIADLVGGEIVGDANIIITGISGIKEAQNGDITFVANSKYFPLIEKTLASAIITPRELNVAGKNIIKTENPSLAFANVAALVAEEVSLLEKGIHPTAVIHDEAQIGENVTIGPNVIIEKNVTVGNNCIIGGGSFIGYRSCLGENCLIYPNVTVLNRTSIGNNVIIHSGTVVGSDGFGYVDVEGVHEKIPQIGVVEIHDDVEIGANVAIDRARFDKTVIGQGTKIDNLVQIAHNVIIGKNCILCGQVGISGSCIVEDNVVLAGQVGLAGHLTVGRNTIVASGSGVPSSIPPDSFYWGFPAKPAMQAKRVNAAVQRLPQYVKTITELKKRVEDLESKSEGKS